MPQRYLLRVEVASADAVGYDGVQEELTGSWLSVLTSLIAHPWSFPNLLWQLGEICRLGSLDPQTCPCPPNGSVSQPSQGCQP